MGDVGCRAPSMMVMTTKGLLMMANMGKTRTDPDGKDYDDADDTYKSHVCVCVCVYYNYDIYIYIQYYDDDGWMVIDGR